MRDVSTLTFGERLTLLIGVRAIAATFAGHCEAHVLVHTHREMIRVPLNDDEYVLHDAQGRVVGVPVDDPVLAGSPPELE